MSHLAPSHGQVRGVESINSYSVSIMVIPAIGVSVKFCRRSSCINLTWRFDKNLKLVHLHTFVRKNDEHGSILGICGNNWKLVTELEI